VRNEKDVRESKQLSLSSKLWLRKETGVNQSDFEIRDVNMIYKRK